MIFPFVSIFTAMIVTRWMFVAIRDMHGNQQLKCALAVDMHRVDGFSTDSIQQRRLRGGILTNSQRQQQHLRGFVDRISM
jgi:hypothetical protein